MTDCRPFWTISVYLSPFLIIFYAELEIDEAFESESCILAPNFEDLGDVGFLLSFVGVVF